MPNSHSALRFGLLAGPRVGCSVAYGPENSIPAIKSRIRRSTSNSHPHKIRDLPRHRIFPLYLPDIIT